MREGDTAKSCARIVPTAPFERRATSGAAEPRTSSVSGWPLYATPHKRIVLDWISRLVDLRASSTLVATCSGMDWFTAHADVSMAGRWPASALACISKYGSLVRQLPPT